MVECGVILVVVVLLYMSETTSCHGTIRSREIRGGLFHKDHDVVFDLAEFDDDITRSQYNDLIVNACFNGMGLSTCKLLGGSAWEVDRSDNMNNVGNGTPFCIDCCSSNRETSAFHQVWDMECSLDRTSAQRVNLFDYEFRLAVFSDQDDHRFVTCDLPRSDPNSFLAGYELTIEIRKQSSAFGDYWNSAISCNCTSWEQETFVESVREVIIITGGGANHYQSASCLLWWMLLLLSSGLLLV